MPERNPLPLLTHAVPRLHLTRADSCLLLQDLHAPFADGKSGWLAVRARSKVLFREFDEYYDALDLISPNICKIVSRARQLALPLLYACLGFYPPAAPSPFQEATGWMWDLSGSEGMFPSGWKPESGDQIIAKPGWGALANPALEQTLNTKGIRNVLVVGTMFEFGIRQTCIELMDLGYRVLVVSDGVAALTHAGRTHTAGAIAHGMIKLRSTGEMMEILARLEVQEKVDV